MMRNDCFKKALVVGIIVLFIGVSVLTSVSSKDISNSDVKMLEYDTKSVENNEIETFDNYKEIITRINGYAELKWIKIRGSFHGRYYGEAEIIKGDNDGVNLLGIRLTNGCKKFFYESYRDYIYAPRFIGHSGISMVPGHSWQRFTSGWAFGNIDWY